MYVCKHVSWIILDDRQQIYLSLSVSLSQTLGSFLFEREQYGTIQCQNYSRVRRYFKILTSIFIGHITD